MGAFIRENELVPDVVLCSGAVRARATLAIVLSVIGDSMVRIEHDDALYLAEPNGILQRLSKVGQGHERVMVVGHNPGLHALALALVGRGEGGAIAGLARKFPTAGLAVIDFEAPDWTAIGGGSGRLRHFAVPKQLA